MEMSPDNPGNQFLYGKSVQELSFYGIVFPFFLFHCALPFRLFDKTYAEEKPGMFCFCSSEFF